MARKLAREGVAAFVLKYRVKCTLRPGKEYVEGLKTQIARQDTNGDADFPQYIPALSDAYSAIKYVRSHAKDFGVDPRKVGILGFSAGAITALSTAERPRNADDAPDFIAPIYPQMNMSLNLPDKPAPVFLAIAGDDELFGRQGTRPIDIWQKMGGDVELHFFNRGGHGYGLARKGSTSDHWFEELVWWMEAQGLLKGAISH